MIFNSAFVWGKIGRKTVFFFQFGSYSIIVGIGRLLSIASAVFSEDFAFEFL